MTQVALDFEHGMCELVLEWKQKRVLLVATPLIAIVLSFLGSKNHASATEVSLGTLREVSTSTPPVHSQVQTVLDNLVHEGVVALADGRYSLSENLVSKSTRILLDKTSLRKSLKTEEKRDSKHRNAKIESIICRIIKRVDGISAADLKMLVRTHLGADLEEATLLFAISSLIENDFISMGEAGTFHFGAGDVN
jgi:hypothetical protein